MHECNLGNSRAIFELVAERNVTAGSTCVILYALQVIFAGEFVVQLGYFTASFDDESGRCVLGHLFIEHEQLNAYTNSLIILNKAASFLWVVCGIRGFLSALRTGLGFHSALVLSILAL